MPFLVQSVAPVHLGSYQIQLAQMRVHFIPDHCSKLKQNTRTRREIFLRLCQNKTGYLVQPVLAVEANNKLKHAGRSRHPSQSAVSPAALSTHSMQQYIT